VSRRVAAAPHSGEHGLLVRMNQSDVSAILSGRRVLAYNVLVRIADGLGIPRDMMGLGWSTDAEPKPDPEPWPEEVDENVERHKLFAIAGRSCLVRRCSGSRNHWQYAAP
jgi:hypothetical protein